MNGAMPALSLRKNGNKQRRIVSMEAPLIFKVSDTSRNTYRCKLRSSMGVPPNCDCYIMDISIGLKLLAFIGGLVMLEVWLWAPEMT